MLRRSLLMLARSTGQESGEHDAGLQRHRLAVRRRRGCRGRRRGDPALADIGLRQAARLPGRGHPRRRAGSGHGRRLPAAAQEPRRAAGLTAAAEVSVKLSAIGQALPGDGERVALDNARRDLPGGQQRRHHGHARHGGPHHDRLHAGDPARAPAGLPVDRRRRPGLPASYRAGLQGPRLRRLAGAAVQGRLQGARVGGLPGPGATSGCRTCGASRP